MAEHLLTRDREQPAPAKVDRRGVARRVVLLGAGIVAGSAVLVLLPLLLGRSSVNRYFVAFGFVGACLGLSCMLHGAWDWARGRQGGAK